MTNLVNGNKYKFEAILFIAADATGGYQIANGGTATASSVHKFFERVDLGGTNGYVANVSTTIGGGFNYGAGLTSVMLRISGSLVCSGTGTFTVSFGQHASNGTSSVLVDSTWSVWDSN